MRKAISVFALFLGIAVWMSCGNGTDEAGRAAETYYNYLIEGKYDAYVAGIAYSDSMTDDYREQMVDLVAQYMAREKEQRRGLVSAKALRDSVFQGMANVFLEVTYGDSTREEISLPMVKCGDDWKMQ